MSSTTGLGRAAVAEDGLLGTRMAYDFGQVRIVAKARRMPGTRPARRRHAGHDRRAFAAALKPMRPSPHPFFVPACQRPTP
jgi:hypothetical protein